MAKEIQVFNTPRESFYINIKDWQMAYANGDKCVAALIGFFENQHKYYLRKCLEQAEVDRKLRTKTEISEYQLQPYKKIRKYLLNLYSINTIRKGVDTLIERGALSTYLDESNNRYYRFIPQPIQMFLDSTWNPFLAGCGHMENPLESYLKEVRKAKKDTGPSIKTDRPPLSKLIDPSIKTDRPPLSKLIDPSIKTDRHNKEYIKNINKEGTNKPCPPNGGFPPSPTNIDFEKNNADPFTPDAISDYEEQEGQPAVVLIGQKEKKKKVAPKKKNGFSESVIEVVEYLNSATGRDFRPETKETARFIVARLKQYDIQDLKDVIDLKTSEWLNDSKMSEYLRPSTLFNESKFETYHLKVKSIQNGTYPKHRNNGPATEVFTDQQLRDAYAQLQSEGYC